MYICTIVCMIDKQINILKTTTPHDDFCIYLHNAHIKFIMLIC